MAKGEIDQTQYRSILATISETMTPQASLSNSTGPANKLLSEDQPNGIGGWLLFFCIAATIFNPLSALSSSGQLLKILLEGDLPTAWLTFLWLTLAELLVISPALFYAGVQLWSRRPNAVGITTNALQISLMVEVGMILYCIVGISVFEDRALANLAEEGFVVRSVGSILYLVWLSYFKRSRRVANTFHLTGSTINTQKPRVELVHGNQSISSAESSSHLFHDADLDAKVRSMKEALKQTSWGRGG